MKKALFATIAALALVAPSAAYADVNFDEFTSPPVTCCYDDTGVTGPIVYADVTVRDGANSGFVMNGSGWNNTQTSGENLFGTLSGSIEFLFTSTVNGLTFDLINGTRETNFLIEIFDGSNVLITSQNVTVGGFPGPGNVENISFADTGIGRALITGNSNFAVDTIIFNGVAVPEPGTWAMMLLGFGAIGFAMRRRRTGIALAQIA